MSREDLSRAGLWDLCVERADPDKWNMTLDELTLSALNDPPFSLSFEQIADVLEQKYLK